MKRIWRKALAIMLSFLAVCSSFSVYVPQVMAQDQNMDHVVIQEIYGGGGNTGSEYKNDYVVLYNPTDTEINLNGWSIQYASQKGSFGTNITELQGKIPANGYYLIQEKAGKGGTIDLPKSDVEGYIDMSATNGKVALAKTVSAVSGKDDENVIDFVGYGAANESEGSGTAPSPSATVCVTRNKTGVDTNDNKSDFITEKPAPKNSKSGSSENGDSKVTSVTVTPDEGVIVSGQELELTCTTEGASIYYQINGGEVTTYDSSKKPVLNSLPATVVVWGEKEGLKTSDKNTYQFIQSVTGSVAATPGAGKIELGSKVELSCATPGAQISYSTDSGMTWLNYTDGIKIEKLPFSISAKAYAKNYAESKISTFDYTSFEVPEHTGDYNMYFGQLHSHTTLSDGAGTVEQAFDYASKVSNLDFLAVTDHSNSFEGSNYKASLSEDAMDNESWSKGKNAAANVTAAKIKNTDNVTDSNSSFLGIYGFEMTWSDGSGHINTFNTPGFENRNNPIFSNKNQSAVNPSGLSTYYNKLAQVKGSVSQFNHPGTTFGDFYDFTNYSEENDKSMDLVEVGNGEGPIGSNGYFPSYGYYTRALDKGWHLAPSNNQDNHKGKWGDANTARTVVLADELTESNLYDAIKNNRVYATEDNDLSIQYTLNGKIMGSVLDSKPNKVNIEAKLSDPTDSSIGKVEVIVNGGKVAASQTVDQKEATVHFDLNNDYSYYYLRVTQKDGDIAVTAPVWTGDVEKAGIASLTSDTVLPIKGEKINLTTSLYNNEATSMEIESIEYSDGKVFKTIAGKDLEGGANIDSLGTKLFSFGYTSDKNGDSSIQVTMKAKINGVSKIYNSVLKLSVADPKTVTKVLIDGTHLNDYVNGYYAGNMTNFINICAKDGIQARIETDSITKDMLDHTDLLVISAPLKYDKAGKLKPSEFTDDFNTLVSNYVNQGGTAVISGLADYQDSNDGDPYTTTTQINHLLKAIGAKTTINSDEVYDPVNNAGQPYRLKLTDINTSSEWMKGIDSSQEYSVYSGCTVNPANESDWLVKGHSTTYSINSKKLKNSEYESDANLNEKVKEDGDAYVLSTEDVGNGKIFVAGTVFMSNFEVQATLDNYGDLQYTNYTVINNILDSIKKKMDVTSIQEVREKGNTGDVYQVEGIVTAGSEENAFFDTIYIQDATGGINVFPVANGSGVKVGQKVRVTGHVDSYQGDKELKIGSGIEQYTVIDNSINEVTPLNLSTAESMNYDKNGGKLVKVQGRISNPVISDGVLSSFLLDDESGKKARIFVDGYISKGFDFSKLTDGKNIVSAVGLVYMNPDGVCLRVRDCSELKLIKTGDDSESRTEDYRTNSSNGVQVIIPPGVRTLGNDGKEIPVEQVQLKVENSGTAFETGKLKLQKALKANGIYFSDKQSAIYYQIELEANGNTVSLSGGKVKVTLAYPENTEKDKYNYKIFHLKSDGKVEIIIPNLENEYLTFWTESFSPFAIVYEAITLSDEKSNGGNSGNQNSANSGSEANDQVNSDVGGSKNNSQSPDPADKMAPKTGDQNNLVYLLYMIGISGAVAAITAKKRKDNCG